MLQTVVQMPESLLRHLNRVWRWLDRHLPVVSIAVSAALFVPGLVIGPSWANALPDALLLLPVALAFLLGWRTDPPGSAVAAVVVALGATAGDFKDAIVPMLVFSAPPWTVGRIMRSRAALSAQLAQRAAELEREREAFARESMRYERTRIARDLHDIVAHNLTMIVIQAAAGRRALAEDPAVAAESLHNIEGGAQSAEVEIEQLVELLGDDGRKRGGGLSQLDELVRRAAKTGLSVTYSFAGNHERVPPDVAEIAYRVVQEAITNAMKHASGAAIRVEIKTSPAELTLVVENDAPDRDRELLAGAGGGYGLAGLRERIAHLHGTLDAAPTATGGWRLVACVPE